MKHAAIRFAAACATAATVLASAAAAEAPHPAVARIIVQEADGTAFGSGTLIDVRDQYGLVATNWHVVRDAAGKIEVLFPSGFRSEARALKLDEDWDLAALVVWRPPIEPAPIARRAPQPGERLTICGYGQGRYRSATGRCTEYYAPKIGLPHELVELDVEARQGDSGGPIFNDRGEVAGVLFGAGQGTTMGAFGGRVNQFLSTLAADIGAARTRGFEAPPLLAKTPQRSTDSPPPLVAVAPSPAAASRQLASTPSPAPAIVDAPPPPTTEPIDAGWSSPRGPTATPFTANRSPVTPPGAAAPPTADWFRQAKSVFAVIGVAAVLLVLVRSVT